MTSPLPDYLNDFDLVLADSSIAGSPVAQRVRARIPEVPFKSIDPEDDFKDHASGKVLYLKDYKGKFLRFCPGTRFYNCCGYRIVHIGENCPLSCTYCILQAYFQDRIMKVWANQEDLFKELDMAFSSNRSIPYRVGTGEFTDSLVLEPLTGYSADLIEFLNNHENVRLELKSKIVDLSWMGRVKYPERILPAWSLNSEYVVKTQEGEVSTLAERLQAAKTCAEAGFRVCLHFDPIIRHPGWQDGYLRTVDMIFDYLRPTDIAYLSLGSFRHMPQLKQVIEANHPQAAYIYDEFITGMDNKMRLLRPLRLEQFKLIADRLKSHGLDEQIYFCMESTENWTEVLGRTPKDVGGLNKHLMNMAFKK